MIRLAPTNSAQTFSIIPSTYSAEELDSATITLTENGTNLSESNVSFTWVPNGNYIDITLTTSLTLSEGQIYSIIIKSNDDIYYKDLVFVSSKTNKAKVYSAPSIYLETDIEDEEYIIL